jgi:hypothetical protein
MDDLPLHEEVFGRHVTSSKKGLVGIDVIENRLKFGKIGL